MSQNPLAIAYRNGYVDALFYGSIAVTDPDGNVLFSFNDPHYRAFLRSSSKMIQAIPVIRSGAAERFGLSDVELAVCCASHTGASYHLEAVTSILKKIGLEEEKLACGPHEPNDIAERNRVICSGHHPTQIHNNCSGKHAGMLATCLAMGWPLESYLEEKHPLQQWILELIAEHTGIAREQIPTSIDGCSLPTPYIPISATSTMLARFIANALDGDAASRKIVDAIVAHPEMIHEVGGFDTVLTEAMHGRGIAKRGAMAIYAVGVDTERFGPVGVAIKLHDGTSDPVPLVVTKVLEKIGALTPEEAKRIGQLDTLPLKNWRGIEVGEVVADFELKSSGN